MIRKDSFLFLPLLALGGGAFPFILSAFAILSSDKLSGKVIDLRSRAKIGSKVLPDFVCIV